MRRSPVIIVCFTLCAAFATDQAFAIQRTFVASTGSDANPCTLTQPCRTFAAAGGAVSPFGEVIVLDSAGYGPVIITKALSIIAAPGIYAGVSVPLGTSGIRVFAGANDVVVLRGLAINGQGGTDGIQVNSAKEVHIENCTVSNMNQTGVRVNGGGYVRIAGTTLRSNGLSGVFVPPGVATTLMIDETQAVHNGQEGFFLNGAGGTTLRNAVGSDNASYGLRATSPSGVPIITVTNGEFSGNHAAGMLLNPTVAPTEVRFSIHGTSVTRNAGDGVIVLSVANPTITVATGSIGAAHIASNGSYGVSTGASLGSNTARAAVTHSTISENGIAGVFSNGNPSTVTSINANTIARNGDVDLKQANSGVLITFGNNALTGSGGSDVVGSLSSRSLK